VTRDIRVNSGASAYIQNITIGSHHLFADEPAEAGGADAGPNPYELVMAALGACTSMTAESTPNGKTGRLRKYWWS
jgi:putative redox protein